MSSASPTVADSIRTDTYFKLHRRESRGDTDSIDRSMECETPRDLAPWRMQQGLCPTCGTKTHKVGFFGKRTALTVEGKVLYGRCLTCERHDDLEGVNYAREQPLALRTQLICSDDSTVISEITTEPALLLVCKNINPTPCITLEPADLFTQDDSSVTSEITMEPKLLFISKDSSPISVITTGKDLPKLILCDNATLISGITLSLDLMNASARRLLWEDARCVDEYDHASSDEEEVEQVEEMGKEAISHIRPEPSLASFHDDRPAAPRRQLSSRTYARDDKEKDCLKPYGNDGYTDDTSYLTNVEPGRISIDEVGNNNKPGTKPESSSLASFETYRSTAICMRISSYLMFRDMVDEVCELIEKLGLDFDITGPGGDRKKEKQIARIPNNNPMEAFSFILLLNETIVEQLTDAITGFSKGCEEYAELNQLLGVAKFVLKNLRESGLSQHREQEDCNEKPGFLS